MPSFSAHEGSLCRAVCHPVICVSAACRSVPSVPYCASARRRTSSSRCFRMKSRVAGESRSGSVVLKSVWVILWAGMGCLRVSYLFVRACPWCAGFQSGAKIRDSFFVFDFPTCALHSLTRDSLFRPVRRRACADRWPAFDFSMRRGSGTLWGWQSFPLAS